jgi:hypothetical protein
MELASEDLLRLQVLLQNVEAVRIDDNALVVYGLSPRGQARIALNPTDRPDRYLRRVREFLSGAVLGSPGGYPLHLQRWTRMGQARDANLAGLLMLGEPEAVTAVAGAPGLTDELARRAWWAAPSADHARRMLARACVVEGAMGKVLAEYLVEHLPFETEAAIIVESVRLVLQPGLIAEPARRRLWERGAQHGAYRIGFLQAASDELPDPWPARADLGDYRPALSALAAAGQANAAALARVLDRPGQSFAAVAADLLARLTDQDAAAALLNAIGDYFRAFRLEPAEVREVQTLLDRADAAVTERHPALAALLDATPGLAREIAALTALAGVSDAIATEILARTTASGSLLQRKLEPVSAPLRRLLARLRGAPHD